MLMVIPSLVQLPTITGGDNIGVNANSGGGATPPLPRDGGAMFGG